MLPSVNKMVILKVLIDRGKPMKGADIQRALFHDYHYKLSLGRISSDTKHLSNEGFVFSSRSCERMNNGSKRIDYSITEQGVEYYRTLRSEYLNYVNTANFVLDLPAI